MKQAQFEKEALKGFTIDYVKYCNYIPSIQKNISSF